MSDLKDKQYINSSNYSARIFLHYKFSSNKNSWPLWLFDNINKIENAKVLEIGCGNGLFWKINSDRIPENWNITLTDFSDGMLKDAEKNIGKGNGNIKYEVMDAEKIPYDSNSFDIIFANHMLYHITDRRKGLSEIRRVLKDDGIFYATTMESGYMKELTDILREFRSLPPIDKRTGGVIENFSLQNGEEQLKEFFGNVELKIYKNSLVIIDAEPLVDYAISLNNITPGRILLHEDTKAKFAEFVQEKININGSIDAAADSGVFISRK
jgi:ubiquinone/menaquinone biosynthesis C-methylase UbiE